MTTYHVAKTGNDSNDGLTLGNAFLTINKGIETMAGQDELVIYAGTYDEIISYLNPLTQPPAGLDWNNPTTIRTATGEEVILKPEAGTFDVSLSVIQTDNTSYVVFEGLILDANGIGSGVRIKGKNPTEFSHHLRFSGGEFRNGGATGNGIFTQEDECTHNEVLNVKIHDFGATILEHGIYFRTADNLIDGCEIYNCSGYGIQCYSKTTDRSVIRNCKIHGNLRGVLATSGVDLKVYNNVIYDNTEIGLELNWGSSDNAEVYNNTAANNGTHGMRTVVQTGETITDAVVRNNISYGHTNNWSDGATNTTESENLFGIDPLFEDENGKDFHLTTLSPAKDAGATIGIVTTDHDGVMRPIGVSYDIGAYEFGVGAATYYVDKTGSDGNPGTSQSPFLTINQGLQSMSGKDSLVIRAGTYDEQISHLGTEPPAGDDWSNVTLIRAEAGNAVIIHPTTPDATQNVIALNSASYIVLQDLIIDATDVTSDGVDILGTAHHIRLTGCEVRNASAANNGIHVSSSSSNFCELLNLNVHDNGSSGAAAGIRLAGPDALVEGSVIQGNQHYGFFCEATAVRAKIESCDVYGNAEGGYTRADNTQMSNNKAYDNSIVGLSNEFGPDSCLFYQNTVVNNSNTGILIGTNSTNDQVINNIAYNNTITDFTDNGLSTTNTTNLFGTDPNFVDEANKDFHLLSSSSAINAGTTVGTVVDDYDGNSRPSGVSYDIGAYEFLGGTTYWVATDGNDTNPGSEASPLLTINEGIDRMMAGDSVVIKAGTYDEFISNVDTQTEPPAGVDWDNATTIRANTGDTVTIQPNTGSTGGHVVRLDATSYVIFQGLIFDGVNPFSYVVRAVGAATNIRFDGCEIKNGPSSGVYLETNNTDWEFTNGTKIYDNGTTTAHHGIESRGTGHRVEDCEIYGHTGNGIHQSSGNNNDWKIYSCLMRNNQYGIHIGSADNTEVFNCIVRDNSSHGLAFEQGSGTACLFYHNTIVDNGGTGIRIDQGGGETVSNTEVKNNISWGNLTNYTNNATATVESDNLFGTDPLFVDEVGNDFRLTTSSPAKNAGAALAAVTDDYDNNTRPFGASHDIGAYEFSEATGTLTKTLLPVSFTLTGTLTTPGSPSSPTMQSLDALTDIQSCVR